MNFLVAAVMILLLGGCGGGGGNDSGGGPVNWTRSGEGYLRIDEPSTSGTYQTDQATVMLTGESFNFTLTPFCPPSVSRVPDTYKVTWKNATTGDAKAANFLVDCNYFGLDLMVTLWRTSNGIPLTMGANSITITAQDGAGNSGSETIIVTRVQDVTPPYVKSVSPRNGADIGLTVTIEIEFSEPMSTATVNSSSVYLTALPDTPVATTMFVDEKSVRLSVVNPVVHGTFFQITVSPDVTDASGNALVSPFISEFSSH